MLIDVRIKNYRSFKDEVIFSMEAEASKLKHRNVLDVDVAGGAEVRLLKLAMIFGGNASGKSNVIRMFFNLINYITKKPTVDETVGMYDPFLFAEETKTKETEFEINFIGPKNIKYSYLVTFNKTQILREELSYYPKGKSANLFTRNSQHSDSSNNIDIGVLGDILGKKEIRVFKNQLLLSKFGNDEPIEELTNVYLYFKKYEIINAISRKHLTKIESDVSAEFLENQQFADKLNSLLRFADTKLHEVSVVKIDENEVPENLKSVVKERVLTNPFLIFGVHKMYHNDEETGKFNALPFVQESQGTQTLFAIGGKVIKTLEEGGVLLVDEIETSLHPVITQMIIQMFQSDILNPLSAQLIFTSHNITLLDRDYVRRDQIWLSEKASNGKSELFSLQDFEGVREETPFDRWYIAGKFGALPNLNSIDTIFNGKS